MKVIYFCKAKSEKSDNTEDHIQYAFEKLGHSVERIDEANWSKSEVVNKTKNADLFLFHKAGITDQWTFQKFMDLIACVVCPKVCWYFDKLWSAREVIVETLIPFVDKVFLTDETWARRHDYKNIEILRQGIGIEDTSLGQFKPELETEIAFVGQVYGDREKFVEKLKERYGNKLRVFGNIFNRDLYDLMASTKVVVAPDSPGDDFYWSSRVYMILGSGGFLIHPKYEGLKEEFTHKEDLVYYSDFDDLCSKIDFYLVNEKKRKKIQEQGYKKCVEKYNYQTRCQKMLEILNIGKNV